MNSESGMLHPKCVQIIGSIPENVHTNLGGRGVPRVDSMWVKVTDICPKHHQKNTKKGDGASSNSGMVHSKCTQIIDNIPGKVDTNLGGRRAPGGGFMWVRVTDWSSSESKLPIAPALVFGWVLAVGISLWPLVSVFSDGGRVLVQVCTGGQVKIQRKRG